MFHEPRFWESLAFVLFFIIFGRVLWRAITSKLDERADNVRSHLDEATRLRREAEQMLEDANREREHALQDAEQLIAASRAEAASLKERAAREAQETVARHEKQARERIEIAEQNALLDIRNEATRVTMKATRDVITEKLAQDPELARLLLDGGLNDLSKNLRRQAA